MLKLSTSYSKKIPAGQEFSSQSFHCAVELELSDNLTPEQLQSQIHASFATVRKAVEKELNGNTPAESPEPTGNNGRKSGNGKASNKQIKFITDLAVQRGLEISDLNAQVQKRFEVPSLYDLSKKDASALVDELKTQRQTT